MAKYIWDIGIRRNIGKKNNALECETWAQYGRMFYQGDSAIMLAGELFPRTTQEIRKIVKEL